MEIKDKRLSSLRQGTIFLIVMLIILVIVTTVCLWMLRQTTDIVNVLAALIAVIGLACAILTSLLQTWIGLEHGSACCAREGEDSDRSTSVACMRQPVVVVSSGGGEVHVLVSDAQTVVDVGASKSSDPLPVEYLAPVARAD